MSDTTGWTRDTTGNYSKEIECSMYTISRFRGGGWRVRRNGYSIGFAIEYLRDAQTAAHDHARSKG